jgi:hypothetical protein
MGSSPISSSILRALRTNLETTFQPDQEGHPAPIIPSSVLSRSALPRSGPLGRAGATGPGSQQNPTHHG